MFRVSILQMTKQSPMGRFRRRRFIGKSELIPRHPDTREIPERRRFDIALDPGHLPSKMNALARAELQPFVELDRCIHIGVAMNRSEAGEDTGLKSGEHPEDSLLFTDTELRLASDQIPKRAALILLSKLHDGVRPSTRSRVRESDRLHRSEGQRLRASPSDFFDRQAALEIHSRFELMKWNGFCVKQLCDEVLILFAGKRDV